MKIYLVSCMLAFAAFSSKVMATEAYILEHSDDGKNWKKLASLRPSIVDFFKTRQWPIQSTQENVSISNSIKFIHDESDQKISNFSKHLDYESIKSEVSSLFSKKYGSQIKLLIIRYEKFEEFEIGKIRFINTRVLYLTWKNRAKSPLIDLDGYSSRPENIDLLL